MRGNDFQKVTTLLVTGGIGSGKSAVCRILQSAGVPVYDSDSRAKALYDSDPDLLAAVAECFGCDIVGEDGRLDRRLLASRAFASEEGTAALNAMVHPAVLRDFVSWRNSRESGLVVLESALAGTIPEYMSEVDLVLFVDADEDIRLARACRRDGSGRDAILARMRRQSFEGLCPDAVVRNNGSMADLRMELESALKKMSIFVKL